MKLTKYQNFKQILICAILLLPFFTWAQSKNPTVWPYGGEPDSSRYKKLWDIIPINFKQADFRRTNFDSLAYLGWAKFHSRANLGKAKFHSRAYFEVAEFDSLADFGGAEFDSLADFEAAEFHSLADFVAAEFHSLANFEVAEFDSLADFEAAEFHSRADFGGAKFHSQVNFGSATFYSLADFWGAKFYSQVNFCWAHSDSIFNFSSALFLDTLFIGFPESNLIQKYDFKTTKLKNKTAKIILWGPVDLNIQREKFKFLVLANSLDYFSKYDIISTLKEMSFKEDRYSKERFELDYLFDKSTMYQVRSTVYGENRWTQIHLWPKWIKNWLYYVTMGLGYRPFRLAWWVLGIIVGFTLFYFFKMRYAINQYILKDVKKEKSIRRRKRLVASNRQIHPFESFVNCMYFSCMMLFTFRLKKDILTFFGLREKRIIVAEYLLGILIYISFLTLAKSGSILHNLKSLFVG